MKKGSPISRFEEKIKKEESGCWTWTSAKSGGGLKGGEYGAFWDGERHTGAHQFSYRHFKGEIGKGLCVIHSCDNPPCVNPEHLSLGTRSENTKDCVKKERHRFGKNKTLKYAKN